ncbi:hypothetical protein C8R43DRAFT_831477, partial [Mycena crocata]
TMDSRKHAPEEVWSEILGLLPRDSLKDVSLTSRSFNRISFPLRFTRFIFHPYRLKLSQDIVPLSTPEVDRALRRLKFWSSDEVALVVRSCSISPLWGGPVDSS